MEIDREQMQMIFEKINAKILNVLEEENAERIKKNCWNELCELSHVGVKAKWLKENGQIQEMPLGIVSALTKREIQLWEERWAPRYEEDAEE